MSVVRRRINYILIHFNINVIVVYLLTSITKRAKKVSVTARFSYMIIRFFSLTMYYVFLLLRFRYFNRISAYRHRWTPFRQIINLLSLHIFSLMSSFSNKRLCSLRRFKSLIKYTYALLLHICWQTLFSFSLNELLKFLGSIRLKVQLMRYSRRNALRPADHFCKFCKARRKCERRSVKSIVHALKFFLSCVSDHSYVNMESKQCKYAQRKLPQDEIASYLR